jgi:hypothetical protein
MSTVLSVAYLLGILPIEHVIERRYKRSGKIKVETLRNHIPILELHNVTLSNDQVSPSESYGYA